MDSPFQSDSQIKIQMEFNPNNQEEDSQHKHKQKIESMRFDLLGSELEFTKLIATQEVDKYRRKCHNLEELVSRLEHDLKINREREIKDQEKINYLLTKMEMNEKDYTEKLVELKMKVFDVECAIETIKTTHCQKKSSFTEAGEQQSPPKIVTNSPIKKVKTGQKGKTASLEKKRLFQTLDSRGAAGASTETNANTLCSTEIAKNTVQMEVPKDLINPSKSISKPLKKPRTSDSRLTLSTMSRDISSCDEVSTEKGRTFCRSSIEDGGKEHKGQVATSDQITSALHRAEMLQSKFCSHNPSFIKSMGMASIGFYLPIPAKFIKENLCTVGPELKMILEDENGMEYYSKYINRSATRGLSGGWKGFATAHNLEFGDALVFELTDPSRFKVYIIKAIQQQSGIVSGKND